MSEQKIIFSEVVVKEVQIVKDLVQQLNKQIDKLKDFGVNTSIKTDDIRMLNSIVGVKVSFTVDV